MGGERDGGCVSQSRHVCVCVCVCGGCVGVWVCGEWVGRCVGVCKCSVGEEAGIIQWIPLHV